MPYNGTCVPLYGIFGHFKKSLRVGTPEFQVLIADILDLPSPGAEIYFKNGNYEK